MVGLQSLLYYYLTLGTPGNEIGWSRFNKNYRGKAVGLAQWGERLDSFRVSE